jgi:hypothetical protein
MSTVFNYDAKIDNCEKLILAIFSMFFRKIEYVCNSVQYQYMKPFGNQSIIISLLSKTR